MARVKGYEVLVFHRRPQELKHWLHPSLNWVEVVVLSTEHEDRDRYSWNIVERVPVRQHDT